VVVVTDLRKEPRRGLSLVVAGLTGDGGYKSEKRKKKIWRVGLYKKISLLVVSGMFFNIPFFFLFFFFFGNQEFLIKIIFIKKSTVTLFNGNIIISFSIFKDPNGHIFQRSYFLNGHILLV
jgi:hypothetical protein